MNWSLYTIVQTSCLKLRHEHTHAQKAKTQPHKLILPSCFLSFFLVVKQYGTMVLWYWLPWSHIACKTHPLNSSSAHVLMRWMAWQACRRQARAGNYHTKRSGHTHVIAAQHDFQPVGRTPCSMLLEPAMFIVTEALQLDHRYPPGEIQSSPKFPPRAATTSFDRRWHSVVQHFTAGGGALIPASDEASKVKNIWLYSYMI